MSLKTMEWAIGLRASLSAEIEAILVRGPISTSVDLGRIVALRAQIKQVDALIASLHDLGMTQPAQRAKPEAE